MGPTVRIRDKDAMHVAGLLLARILERATLAGARPALLGNVGIDVGGMRATIVPSPGGDEVVAGFVPPLAATVRAPLTTFLYLGRGGNPVRAFFFGGLRPWGSPRALLGLRALLAPAGGAR